MSYTELYFFLEVLKEKVEKKERLVEEEYEVWKQYRNDLEIIKGFKEKEEALMRTFDKPLVLEEQPIVTTKEILPKLAVIKEEEEDKK